MAVIARPITHIAVAIVALFATLTAPTLAQTPPPATPTVATDLGEGCTFDLPANWVRTPDVALGPAFLQRGDASLVAAYHPEGSRPTDLPYALIEEFGTSANPTQAEMTEAADRVRTYYLTALRPPSKADRSAGWKNAIVTPIIFDLRNRRFSFRATIHYDAGGDYFVDVSGVFGNQAALVVSVWSDTATRATHGSEIAAVANGVRFGGGAMPQSFGESLLSFARIAGVVLIAAVIAIQVFVLWRERRQRAAERDALIPE